MVSFYDYVYTVFFVQKRVTITYFEIVIQVSIAVLMDYLLYMNLAHIQFKLHKTYIQQKWYLIYCDTINLSFITYYFFAYLTCGN